MWHMHSKLCLDDANAYGACRQALKVCAIPLDSYVILFFLQICHSLSTIFHPSSHSLLKFFFKMSYIIKRNAKVFYSVVKSPIKIWLWNIETFKHLERSLIHWLDWDIGDGEKIRMVERLITMFNNNEEHHVWE